MDRPRRHLWRPAALLALLIATGCAASQPTRFYLLTPLHPAPPGSAAGPAVGLRPVELPAELDRPQIVTRSGENRVELAEFDRWASPLAEQFTRVLAQDLAALLPVERVAVFPWGRHPPIQYEVAVEVLQAVGALQDRSTLEAHWTVTRPGGREAVAHGRFTASAPAGEGYAGLVAAQGRLVADLAREIAAALRALPR